VDDLVYTKVSERSEEISVRPYIPQSRSMLSEEVEERTAGSGRGRLGDNGAEVQRTSERKMNYFGTVAPKSAIQAYFGLLSETIQDSMIGVYIILRWCGTIIKTSRSTKPSTSSTATSNPSTGVSLRKR
jgi:hypothetical protein